MPTLEKKALLKCLICDEAFTLLDVRAGSYVGATGICIWCYLEMKEDTSTCFGKETVGKVLGYDQEAIECQTFCPDKEVCQEFVKDTVSKKFNP